MVKRLSGFWEVRFLDEYVGFSPQRHGGMEVSQSCVKVTGEFVFGDLIAYTFSHH